MVVEGDKLLRFRDFSFLILVYIREDLDFFCCCFVLYLFVYKNKY